MKQYCENALKVAKYLERTGLVESIAYPSLEGNKYHELAKKYLPLGCSGVISFSHQGSDVTQR